MRRSSSALIWLLTGSIVGACAELSQAEWKRIICNGNRLTVAALFNDRTTFAWIIVICYFAGAGASFWAWTSAESRERRFWLATAILLVLLGLNKELDLKNALTQSARAVVRFLGLYEHRRLMQGGFLLLLGTTGVMAAFLLAGWLRRSSRSARTATVGIALLFAFVILRAASFHHIDQWVTIDVAGLRIGWWLELAGIAVIGVSALLYRGRPNRRRPGR